MPVKREDLELALAEVNAELRKNRTATVARFEPDRFTLAFPDQPLSDGRCIDEKFSEVQFVLNERANVFTNLVGARFDEDEDRFLVDYEVVELD